MATESDLNHLRVLENGPFYPIGWLYTGVYESLRERGLVQHAPGGQGYCLSPEGKALLESADAKVPSTSEWEIV